jgi:hypothetical protein
MENGDPLWDIANSDGLSLWVGTRVTLRGKNDGDGEPWFRLNRD